MLRIPYRARNLCRGGIPFWSKVQVEVPAYLFERVTDDGTDNYTRSMALIGNQKTVQSRKI